MMFIIGDVLQPDPIMVPRYFVGGGAGAMQVFVNERLRVSYGFIELPMLFQPDYPIAALKPLYAWSISKVSSLTCSGLSSSVVLI